MEKKIELLLENLNCDCVQRFQPKDKNKNEKIVYSNYLGKKVDDNRFIGIAIEGVKPLEIFKSYSVTIKDIEDGLPIKLRSVNGYTGDDGVKQVGFEFEHPNFDPTDKHTIYYCGSISGILADNFIPDITKLYWINVIDESCTEEDTQG